MTTIIMLLMTMARKMEMNEAAMVINGNIDATSIGNGDGGPSNIPQEEPTKEGFN